MHFQWVLVCVNLFVQIFTLRKITVIFSQWILLIQYKDNCKNTLLESYYKIKWDLSKNGVSDKNKTKQADNSARYDFTSVNFLSIVLEILFEWALKYVAIIGFDGFLAVYKR